MYVFTRLEGSVALPGSDLTISVGPKETGAMEAGAMEAGAMEAILGKRKTRGSCCLWANFYCKRPCSGKPCRKAFVLQLL